MREFEISDGFLDLINPQLKVCRILRVVKYLRIVLVLKEQNISKDIRICLNHSCQTLKSLKDFLYFYFLMVIMFALIGYNLFQSSNEIKQISFNTVP